MFDIDVMSYDEIEEINFQLWMQAMMNNQLETAIKLLQDFDDYSKNYVTASAWD